MSELRERLTKALADRYAIVREVGSGGMATIYLAEDRKHQRQVAIKVLRPELAAAVGSERFLQEITIAANLRHPHILPLYDSGEADGFLYYVMPYVENESLRDRLDREKQLPIDDALQVARDVADALSYAHAQGVIHRDIKPENILLESGHAVVADFGLARAIAAAGGERLTATGIAVGTPAYMSPEQAAGEEELDGRSDLYSLGCVLFEMLAGQPPFTGPTVERLVFQHLSVAPPSVTSLRPSVPGWVAAAVERSLAKIPADRFNPVAQFAEAIAPRAAAIPAEVQPTRSSNRWLAPVILAVALMAVITMVVLKALAPHPLTITTSGITRVTRDPGVEFQPAISPDGERVAYVEGPIGHSRIVVRSTREIGGGGQTRPGAELDGSLSLPAWTPDGNSIRFYASSGGQIDWMEGDMFGSPARTVFRPMAGRDVNALSLDGTRVAAVGRSPVFAPESIFTYAADDGEPQLLGLHVADPWSPHSFAWSPDGRWIAYVNGNPGWRSGANVAPSSIWILDTHGGDPVRVTDGTAMDMAPQWLPDGRHLLFVSDRDGTRGIYSIEVGRNGPRGPPRAVAGASGNPHSISVSADGKRLAWADFDVVQNIWSVPIPESGSVSIRDAVPVTTGNQVIESHDVSPDGEWIVFDSNIRGAFAIYRQRLAGGSPEPLPGVDGDAFEPEWSPDGSEVAFYAALTVGGQGEIFVVSADGSTPPEQITRFPGVENQPDWSPDGLAIAYSSQGPQGTDLLKIWMVTRDSAGGRWSEPAILTDFYCIMPAWAPDGESLVCQTRDESVRVSRSGDVITHYGRPAGLEYQGPGGFDFSRDSSKIYFHAVQEDGSHGLWWLPAEGGEPARVVAFDDPARYAPGNYSLGPDHMYVTIAVYESDIWVMDLEW